jgi:hypothetical protein
MATIPAQYTEHALARTPLLLPAQSLQLPSECAALKASGTIVAIIEAARMPLPAGPNTKDRMSTIVENRSNTPAMMRAGYLFPIWNARGTPSQAETRCKLSVRRSHLRQVELDDLAGDRIARATLLKGDFGQNVCPRRRARSRVRIRAATGRDVLACAFCLDRWTGPGPVRVKHTAIAVLRLEPGAAAFAIVKELASIRRHRF